MRRSPPAAHATPDPRGHPTRGERPSVPLPEEQWSIEPCVTPTRRSGSLTEHDLGTHARTPSNELGSPPRISFNWWTSGSKLSLPPLGRTRWEAKHGPRRPETMEF